MSLQKRMRGISQENQLGRSGSKMEYKILPRRKETDRKTKLIKSK